MVKAEELHGPGLVPWRCSEPGRTDWLEHAKLLHPWHAHIQTELQLETEAAERMSNDLLMHMDKPAEGTTLSALLDPFLKGSRTT